MSIEARLTTRVHPIQLSGPLVESASGLGAGPQHHINRKHASSSWSGPTAPPPAASQGWDIVILTLMHASSWQTNQFVLLWFHYHQASAYIQPELGHEQQHPSDRCSSTSFASWQTHRLCSSATAEEHRKKWVKAGNVTRVVDFQERLDLTCRSSW